MDVIEHLLLSHRKWSSGSPGCRDCGTNEPCVSQRAADEIRQLRQWKRESTEVLLRWRECWEVAGQPGTVGGSISEATYKEIVRLKISSVAVAMGIATDIGMATKASHETQNATSQQEVGDDEELPCTCGPGCKFCKGECGCKACHRNYMDFLSNE